MDIAVLGPPAGGPFSWFTGDQVYGPAKWNVRSEPEHIQAVAAGPYVPLQ